MIVLTPPPAIIAFLLLFATFAVGLRCFADFDKGLLKSKLHGQSYRLMDAAYSQGLFGDCSPSFRDHRRASVLICPRHRRWKEGGRVRRRSAPWSASVDRVSGAAVTVTPSHALQRHDPPPPRHNSGLSSLFLRRSCCRHVVFVGLGTSRTSTGDDADVFLSLAACFTVTYLCANRFVPSLLSPSVVTDSYGRAIDRPNYCPHHTFFYRRN